MRRRSIVATVAGLAIVACLAGYAYAWRPAIAPLAAAVPASTDRTADPGMNATTDPTALAAGLRVMSQGDCMYCHTAKGGKAYAGGLPIDTPFGTIYSTNITPDAKTGIGTWSLEAFTRAMREGVSRDGHLLYPAFPYVHFTRMHDEDIAAAYTYLMSRTPVEAPARANSLLFPLGFRPLMAGWNLLFLDRGALPKPAGNPSEAWLLGRYLVEGAGHCQACHTPMNLVGAEARGKAFAGGVIDGWDAPPLNALASGTHPWSKAQLVSYLRTGIASEHGAAAGPMRPVTQHLGEVPESDVAAIATYLLALNGLDTARATAGSPASAAAPSAVTLSADDQARVTRGSILFSSTCASCHGAAAPMMTIGGRPSLATSTNVRADSPRNTLHMILEGNPWQGSTSAHYMPGYAALLTDEQIVDVSAYLRVQVAGRPPWADAASLLATLRKETHEK